MASHDKYRDYFTIDEDYFPQVNDSAIAASPNIWKNTYPHNTFIDVLKSMERVLAKQEKRSVWIEGAYGTGKSQCAYTLKKILEAPEAELREYWEKYEPLKNNMDLLEKLISHKRKGIIAVHRYASGMIRSPRDLFIAVQDSLKTSLKTANMRIGENTLKESAIAWIGKPANKQWFNYHLSQPEYSSMFPQSSADQVISALSKGGDTASLMGNIFRLADKEGVTALDIDADKLIIWLEDIIKQNDIRIVFIWDEFSDYFLNNRDSLSDFQKLVESVNRMPFYFIVVTHESGQLFAIADEAWKKVRDRFIPVHITMPDNIAFDLIGHALEVKQAVKDNWDIYAGDLNDRLKTSRERVMAAAKIKNNQVIKNIMPLHPMAAILLKNIAAAFKSNQRSMFDFIKSSSMNGVKAFQWFIANVGPLDDHPLLTVDMLWDFFYEKGRDDLDSDIRLILDTFPQQRDLREDEKAVLKAILIMQAIDQRLGGAMDLLKATEQNLSYVFEGIPDLEGTRSANLAKGLKDKGIIVANPLGDGRYFYAAAVLAGDQAKIDGYKKQIRQESTTSKLVADGALATALSLPPALRLRFEHEPGTGKIAPVTRADFKRSINSLREKHTGWKFHAVTAFAKDDKEAAAFRREVKASAADKKYEDIVFIDALSTPLGLEAFEQYVDFSAMAMYYHGNNNDASRESADKARRVLEQDWKNRIYNGPFFVYTYANKDGEKLSNGQGVASALQVIVTTRFPFTFDFVRNLTESQLKLTRAKPSAKAGISKSTSGIVAGIEKHVLNAEWNVERYWESPLTASHNISKIKVEVDSLIDAAFAREGQISIGEIYSLLEEQYGFAPCDLSAFLAGFLLKEFSGEPFRYGDQNGSHEPMTQDKLAEMLGNYIGKSPKPTYIVKMTAEEMAFYEFTEKSWGIEPNTCSSAGQAAIAVETKLRDFGLPIWCLEEVDTAGAFSLVQKYIELVQKKEGDETHKRAVEIGKAASAKPSLADSLSALLTAENCQKGMREFLRSFDGGRIMDLANEIGAQSNVLADVRRLFKVRHSCLWDKQTGMDEIRKLLSEYGIAKESNLILDASTSSLSEAIKEWRERLNHYCVSHEALRAKYPMLKKTLGSLLKICQGEDILPDQQIAFLAELSAHGAEIRALLGNGRHMFSEVYMPYLDDLGDNDIGNLMRGMPTGLFVLKKTDCNAKVKEAAEIFRMKQLKSQLSQMWREKTGTKDPREWSNHNKTPILCCVPDTEFEKAKRAFDTLNRNQGTDSEIKDALAFLESTKLFDVLSDERKRDAAFERDIVGKYRVLLPDLDKVKSALSRLAVDIYDWRDNPIVKGKMRHLAEAEYHAGGSDKAVMKIDKMSGAQLKKYLKQLVEGSPDVGIEILADGGGQQDAN